MSRLINLFRSLSSQEVKRFGQFFQSPYYNATPKMQALYRDLKKRHPECLFTDEDKRKLFAQIFDTEKYSLKKMNNLMASLSSILQDFVLLQYMKRGTIERRKGLYEAYHKRKLNRYSFQQLRYLQKDFEQQPDTTAFRYYEQFRLHHELYFHSETQLIEWQEAEDYNYLKSALYNLKLFYVHFQLNYFCEIKFRGDITPIEFELTPEELKAFEKIILHNDAPLTEIYWLLSRILQKHDDEIYQQLKGNIFKYIKQYKPKNPTPLVTLLTNYQSKRIMGGYIDALGEMLDIYKLGLDHGLYVSKQGHLHTSHFINIAILASELGEVKWLANFIDIQKERLKADERTHATHLCLAFLHFAKSDFGETIKATNFIKREAPPYALACWTLEIRAAYMLKEQGGRWDMILNNFYAYLRRNENISEKVKTANHNFITFIRHLYKASYQKKYTKEMLLQELQSKEEIVCKRWLRDQIERLK